MLIDLEMPDKDGLALATEIRRGGGLNGTSMLFLISAAENRAVGLTWPFDGFLQKPIDCQTLSRLIGSRTYPNPLLPGPADAGGQGGIELRFVFD